MSNCKVAWVGKGRLKKLKCLTHEQTLFYVYQTNQGIVFVCQVGEDEIAEKERRKRILGKDEAKRFEQIKRS